MSQCAAAVLCFSGVTAGVSSDLQILALCCRSLRAVAMHRHNPRWAKVDFAMWPFHRSDSGWADAQLDKLPSLEASAAWLSRRRRSSLHRPQRRAAPAVAEPCVARFLSSVGAAVRELSFAGVSGLTDSMLRHVGAVCTGLRSLNIAGAARVTDSGIKYVAKGCKKLASVTFSERGVLGRRGYTAGFWLQHSGRPAPPLVTSRSVYWLAWNAHCLKALRLGNSDITPSALIHLARASNPAARGGGLLRLVTLDVHGCGGLTGFDGRAGVVALLANAPALQHLDISQCGNGMQWGDWLLDGIANASCAHCLSVVVADAGRTSAAATAAAESATKGRVSLIHVRRTDRE